MTPERNTKGIRPRRVLEHPIPSWAVKGAGWLVLAVGCLLLIVTKGTPT